MAAQSPETQIAVLSESVRHCQKEEEECRELNRVAHADFYRRIGVVELELGKLGVRIGMWAAAGSVIGGGVVGMILYFLQKRLEG